MTAERGAVRLILPAIVAAAALIRIVFLAQLSRSDLGAILPLDMRFYHDLASTLASGGSLPQGGLTFNPLYPLFLVPLFRIFGDGLLAPRILQALAGLATIWMIYVSASMLARVGAGGRGVGEARLRGDVAGTAAAVLALLYPQLLLYEGSLLATSLVTLIMAASFMTAIRISRSVEESGRTSPVSAAGLGLLSGAGVMGRPNIFLILAPLLAVWLFASCGRKWRPALLFLAGIAVVLAPSSIYNLSRAGTPVPVTTHGGINLYVGNMKGANGLYSPPDGMRRDMRGLIEDSRAVAERAERRKMTDAEVSKYWSARARESIAADPGGWLLLLGRKAMLYWNGGELGDIVDLELMREECPVFGLLVVRFALISTLAFAGAALIVIFDRRRYLLMIFLFSSMAGIVLFYFNTRYRLPSVPLLAATAGYFVAWAVSKVSKRRWKEAAAAAAVLVLFFLFVSGREVFAVNRSATWTFLGNHYMSEGDDEKALEAFSEAAKLDPGRIESRINLARALSRTGDREGARLQYEAAWKADPDFPLLAIEYGHLLEELGMRAGAKTLYNHAWSSGRKREMIVAAKLLSRMSDAEGDREAAVYWIEKALELAPGDRELLRILDMLEGS